MFLKRQADELFEALRSAKNDPDKLKEVVAVFSERADVLREVRSAMVRVTEY